MTDNQDNEYFKVSHEYTDFRGHPQQETVTVIAPDEDNAKKQAHVQFHNEVEDEDTISVQKM